MNLTAFIVADPTKRDNNVLEVGDEAGYGTRSANSYKIEALPFDGRFHDIAVEGRTDDEITYHVVILHEAGLIEAMDLSTMSGICWKPQRLTYAGHQFLDAARSDTVWEKVGIPAKLNAHSEGKPNGIPG